MPMRCLSASTCSCMKRRGASNLPPACVIGMLPRISMLKQPCNAGQNLRHWAAVECRVRTFPSGIRSHLACELQATAWAAINGAGLALVLPCCQSLVADYFRPESRGSGFACLFTASAIGEHRPAPGGFSAKGSRSCSASAPLEEKLARQRAAHQEEHPAAQEHREPKKDSVFWRHALRTQ